MKHAGMLALVAGVALAAPQLSFGQFSPPPTPTSRCVANCDVYVPPAVPAGPTPEELRRLREAKDSREAADDAEDRGIAAYEKGDYEGAVAWFKEALEFAPDDDSIRANLAKAQQKAAAQRQAREAAESRRLAEARNTEAMRQLQGVHAHSTTASQTTNTREAQRGIDTGRTRESALPPVAAASGGRADPVVPAQRRTPAITAMERERTEARQRIQALEQRLATLDPRKDSVEIAKAKQEKSTAESKVQYLNFSIGEALEKPQAPQ